MKRQKERSGNLMKGGSNMGFFKKLIKLKFYVGLMGVGYLMHSCVYNNQRYRIRYERSTPHLLDTYKDQSLEIQTDTFQVGSATYRLQGLLKDCNLEQAIANTKQLLEDERK